jgi:endonuclease III
VSSDEKKRADDVRKRLARAMPEPECELDFDEPWHLVIATILSAQSTDKMVNSVTPELFRHYPTPADLAGAEVADVERLIKSTGFYRNKTKSIMGASRVMTDEHGGEVPRTMDAITKLPGVARKTGNLVLGTAFGIATGIIVDTHAGRVARRLGLSEQTDPKKVERDLTPLWPKRSWVDMGHRLVLHGRYVCTSKSPSCGECPLFELCPSAEGDKSGRWGARADAEGAKVRAQ